MVNRQEVLHELKELKQLEFRLVTLWNGLRRAGRNVQPSFVLSLGELEVRAMRLEKLLGI